MPQTLDKVQLKERSLDDAIKSGELKITGNPDAFTEFMGMIDDFPFWFNIVTP